MDKATLKILSYIIEKYKKKKKIINSISTQAVSTSKSWIIKSDKANGKHRFHQITTWALNFKMFEKSTLFSLKKNHNNFHELFTIRASSISRNVRIFRL